MNTQEREKLLQVLKARFEKNMRRHPDIAWEKVQARLEGNRRALRSLQEMDLISRRPVLSPPRPSPIQHLPTIYATFTSIPFHRS